MCWRWVSSRRVWTCLQRNPTEDEALCWRPLLFFDSGALRLPECHLTLGQPVIVQGSCLIMPVRAYINGLKTEDVQLQLLVSNVDMCSWNVENQSSRSQWSFSGKTFLKWVFSPGLLLAVRTHLFRKEEMQPHILSLCCCHRDRGCPTDEHEAGFIESTLHFPNLPNTFAWRNPPPYQQRQWTGLVPSC